MFKWISDLKSVDSPTEDRQAIVDWMRNPQIQLSELAEMLECLTAADLSWNLTAQCCWSCLWHLAFSFCQLPWKVPWTKVTCPRSYTNSGLFSKGEGIFSSYLVLKSYKFKQFFIFHFLFIQLSLLSDLNTDKEYSKFPFMMSAGKFLVLFSVNKVATICQFNPQVDSFHRVEKKCCKWNICQHYNFLITLIGRYF